MRFQLKMIWKRGFTWCCRQITYNTWRNL